MSSFSSFERNRRTQTSTTLLPGSNEYPQTSASNWSRAHLAGVAHQVAEQDELPLRQGDHPVAETKLAALQVEPHPAGIEPPRRRGSEVLVDAPLDPLDQLGDGERFG
jgi:hypothetical protein